MTVEDLKVWFPVKRGVFARTVGHVKAVDGVSFSLDRGETLGLVGESGSGKSTIARVIAGLVRPSAGRVALDGRFGFVFQDPLGSLNPRMTVRAILEEALRGRHPTAELLASVGMGADALDKYPHAFSGGQRQRICIARALALDPDLLICDEAVSALDLSVRAQVLDLLAAQQASRGFAMLFITHDLGVVRHVADRLVVLCAGRVVEAGPGEEVLSAPAMDYTRRLVAAVPRIG